MLVALSTGGAACCNTVLIYRLIEYLFHSIMLAGAAVLRLPDDTHGSSRNILAVVSVSVISFTPRCFSSLSSINEYLAIDRG